MWRPFSSTTFLRWSGSSRWIGLRPTTPGTSPSRPRTSTRWPTRICGSQPPIGANQRKPFSSMWVTTRPISSMWPTTASSGAVLADPGDRGAEPVGWRARRRRPPRARRRRPAPRGRRGRRRAAACRGVRGSRPSEVAQYVESNRRPHAGDSNSFPAMSEATMTAWSPAPRAGSARRPRGGSRASRAPS